MKSSLERFAHLFHEPHDVHARAAAREAWVNGGIVLINPEWLGWAERQQVINIADKLHGKRRPVAGG